MDSERALVVVLYHRFQNGKLNSALSDILPVALVFEIEANK